MAAPERFIDRVSARLQSRRLAWLQGELILPTARTIYLVGAVGALCAVIAALAIALIFHLSSLRSGPDIPSMPDVSVTREPMSMDPVLTRLLPPSNIAFSVDGGSITAPVGAATIIGTFSADSANGMADAPDDFDVIGGSSMAMFETAAAGNRTGLRPAPELEGWINNAVAGTSSLRRGFQLRVVATDKSGNPATADIRFSIVAGPTAAPTIENCPPAATGFVCGAVIADAAPAMETAAADEFDDALGTVARKVALRVDPKRTDVYFGAFERAKGLPERCAAGGNDDFTSEYSRAFDAAKARLQASNVEAFYEGVCDAWAQSVGAADAARASAQAEAQGKIGEAIAKRTAVEIESAIAKVARNAAIAFAGGALLLFLTVAMLLGFLAIEGHSKAVREAIEALARREGERT